MESLGTEDIDTHACRPFAVRCLLDARRISYLASSHSDEMARHQETCVLGAGQHRIVACDFLLRY
jgi:hypothetical protein